MNGERPSSPVHDVQASRSSSETRVRPRTDSDKTLPPDAPPPAKRRALLLVEGADEEERRSYDGVLTEGDVEGELATLPKVDSPEPPPTSSLSPKENLSGQLLDGRYQIDYVLGIGSMGVVYGARHAAVGKLVAVKALRAHLASDAEALQRFNAEATAATSIGNEHIVETFDFGRLPDGTAYLVMEYLEGRPLAEVVEGWAPLPLLRITKIGVQIAEALNAAHLAGIVHRDLKPDNVFLCARENDPDFVKILDFGIAKFGVSQARLTQAGAVFGTPAYMSPEQASGKPTDGRTDVYALGVMLYEMACGRVPFQGESALAVLSMHSNEEPEALSLRQPDVSKELEAIVHKCLRKDPDARYATMAELAADLARLASGVPVRAETAPPSSRVDPRQDVALGASPEAEPYAAPPPPSSVRGSGGVPFPLVLLLLLGVAGGMFWVLRHRAPTIITRVTQAEPNPLPPPLPSAAEVDDGAPEQEVALVLFPLDARVLLGDRDLGQMPVSVKVKDGQPVKLRIVRDGYWTRKLTVDGSKKRVVVGLVKRDASAKVSPEQEGDEEPSGALPRSVPTAR
jgi:eukaryotic-like serine/threonine-protein kinase